MSVRRPTTFFLYIFLSASLLLLSASLSPCHSMSSVDTGRRIIGTENQIRNEVAHSWNITSSANGYQGLCNEIIQMLPASGSLVTHDTSNPQASVLIVPDKHQGITLHEWTVSSEDRFRAALPDDYRRVLDYLEKNNIERSSLTILHTEADVYNRGYNNSIFLIRLNEYTKSYIVDLEPERKGFKRVFDDNNTDAVPFVYKGLTLFAKRRATTFQVISYDLPDENRYITNVCEFSLNRNLDSGEE
jgi:hypothetical protein